jgi:anti-sigma factor RsiW
MSRASEDHRRFEGDLAAYLLDNLDDADRIAFEAHLDQCERCRSDLDWLRPTVGEVATSVPQLEPPRRLRRRTLAAARAAEAPARRRSETWIGLPRFAAIGGAVTALLAVAIVVVSLVNDSGPGTSTVPVQAAEAGVDGSLVVDDGTAVLEVARMPQIPSNRVYETWIQRDGKVEPSSTFIVDRNGTGTATIPRVEGADRVMVTSEPRGGSDRPTTAPLLEASL